MKRIAVLGAGISGLTVADLLTREGHRVTLFERGETVGGLAATREINGQRYDTGPHEFCTDNPTLVAFLEELLGDDLLVRHKKVAQYFRGKLIDYPLKPFHLLRQLDGRLLGRAAGDMIRARAGRLLNRRPDASFESWVRSRFGDYLYDLYFRPYTEKVWGIDPAGLDGEVASERISFDGLFDVLRQTLLFTLFRREQYRSAHNPLKAKFYYARRGIGTIAERLKERCAAGGCEIRTGWEVRRTIVRGGVLERIVNGEGEEAGGYDAWVSMLPVTVLNRAMGREELNAGLGFRSMILCYLEIPLPRLSPYHWIYFPDGEQRFQRITEFSHFDADMTRAGHTGICVEWTCFADDPVWKATSGEIVDGVVRDLLGAGLLPSAEGVAGRVHRERFAYPMKVKGYRRMVKRAISGAATVGNLHFTGRQGLYKYCNMNECMEISFDLARAAALGGRVRLSLESTWKGAGID